MKALLAATVIASHCVMLTECFRSIALLFKSRPQRLCPSPTVSGLASSKVQQMEDAAKLSLAPMMEYTDQHFRRKSPSSRQAHVANDLRSFRPDLVRLISSQTLLYTEMVAANAIASERKDRINDYIAHNPGATLDTAVQNYDSAYIHRRYLAHAPTEGASVLQLGGSDPETLGIAVQTLSEIPALNYTAVNLNCGCPSPKVAGRGCFGAALMNDPDRVASIVTAMSDASDNILPVTVKCRIGVENFDYDTSLRRFIDTVAATGAVRHFDVHARVAMLNLSPHGNRNIPPLRYDAVYRLVSDYPDIKFSLNGGLNTLGDVQSVLSDCPEIQGCMIGRAWAADPWRFATADTTLYGCNQPAAQHRWQVLEAFGRYADAEEAKASTVKELGHLRRRLLKAITPLFAGEIRGKQYRIALDSAAQLIPTKKDGGSDKPPGHLLTPPLSSLILDAAAKHLSDEVLYRSPQESHDKVQWELKRKTVNEEVDGVVSSWQRNRKQEQMSAPQ